MNSLTGTPAGIRAVPLLALAFNVPVGIVAYAFGFMHSYFMSDQIDSGDHLRFIGYGLVALTISTALMAAVLHKAVTMPLGRAVGTALISGAVLHAAFIALVVSLVN
ncbi:hypothetical protein [Aeromicrobium sp. UC242_57]|uniref:hypothetical protein n=1 Tax=Aeromicrobium sp. UC242_57 TaxID=3374624 RepID=UPI003799B05E